MAARARYPLNFAPAQSNQHYGAAGAAPQPINPRTHAIQPRDNRTAFGAANSSLKARYYNEVHDSTYEECMSLSIEAKNALRKRNETWMQPNLQFIGDRNIPDANWVHGDDFPKLTDEQIAALLQSLDGLEKGDKSEAVPAVGDKQCRVTFWKDRLQPLPRGLRAIKINCLEDLRPGKQRRGLARSIAILAPLTARERSCSSGTLQEDRAANHIIRLHWLPL